MRFEQLKTVHSYDFWYLKKISCLEVKTSFFLTLPNNRLLDYIWFNFKEIFTFLTFLIPNVIYWRFLKRLRDQKKRKNLNEFERKNIGLEQDEFEHLKKARIVSPLQVIILLFPKNVYLPVSRDGALTVDYLLPGVQTWEGEDELPGIWA